MNEIEREINHLPPLARNRAAKALGLPQKPPAEHRVFVYGTLLAGERNAHRALGARRVNAVAVGTLYDTGYGFPAFTRTGGTTVYGEMLTTDDEGLRSMDRLEGHPRFYRREVIDVLANGMPARAWVYIMNTLPETAKVIATGNWRTRNG